MRRKGTSDRLLADVYRTALPRGKGYLRAPLDLMFERKDRIEAKAKIVAEWQARNEFLRPLKSHEERLNRLRDWDFFHSRQYEELQWRAEDKRKQAGLTSPVVRFERAFVKRCREYGIPVFCEDLWGDAVRMLHCHWLDRLSLAELSIYNSLGLEAGGPAKVRFGEGLSSYWWECEPIGREGEHVPFPWRLPSPEEVNERCDDAAAGAARINVLQEELADVQMRLRDEMDRVRLSRR